MAHSLFVVGTENTNGNNFTFNSSNVQNAPVTADPYASPNTAANGFSSENAWVMAQSQSPNIPWTFTTHTITENSTPATCGGKKPDPSITSGNITKGANYCAVSGTATLGGTGTYNIVTLGSAAQLGVTGTATYNIGTVNGGTLGSGTYDIYQVSSGVTISGNGTYWIQNLPSTGSVTLDSSNGGAFYINSLPGNVTLQGNGTFYINTVQSGVTIDGGGKYYINTLSSGVTLGGTGTYYINNLPAGVTLNGTGTYYLTTVSSGMTLNGNATYYIDSVTTGTTLDGTNGGKFYINSATGVTFKNGVYYITTLNGPVTSTNATLVVFSNISAGNSAFSLSAPTANTPGADNKGLALVSPNAISIEFDGNGSLQGSYLCSQYFGSRQQRYHERYRRCQLRADHRRAFSTSAATFSSPITIHAGCKI